MIDEDLYDIGYRDACRRLPESVLRSVERMTNPPESSYWSGFVNCLWHARISLLDDKVSTSSKEFTLLMKYERTLGDLLRARGAKLENRSPPK